jgi:hypothetical protein
MAPHRTPESGEDVGDQRADSHLAEHQIPGAGIVRAAIPEHVGSELAAKKVVFPLLPPEDVRPLPSEIPAHSIELVPGPGENERHLGLRAKWLGGEEEPIPEGGTGIGREWLSRVGAQGLGHCRDLIENVSHAPGDEPDRKSPFAIWGGRSKPRPGDSLNVPTGLLGHHSRQPPEPRHEFGGGAPVHDKNGLVANSERLSPVGCRGLFDRIIGVFFENEGQA